MSKVLVEEGNLTNIANAIRAKGNTTSVYKPGEMAAAISNLPSGGGSSDNEDGLLENTLVNYENTTATMIRDAFFRDSDTLATVSFTNVSNVGNVAFMNCKALTQANLPKADTLLQGCFRDSSRLSTVNLSNARILGEYSFMDCTSLTSIKLPRIGVLQAGTFANCAELAKADLDCKRFNLHSQFNGCIKLTTVILRSDTLCTLQYSVDQIFNNSPITNASLGEGYVYVPRALVNEYKNESNWVVIADRIRAIEDYPEITGG